MSGRERYNGRGVPVLPPVKTIFSEVCKTYNLSLQELQILADRAGVTRESVTHLIIGEPVSRMDAEKVLSALTQLTGQTWSLKNVNVPLIDEGGTP